MRGGAAFELGGGEGDCDNIGEVSSDRLAPRNSPDRLTSGQQMRAGEGRWLLSQDGRWGMSMQSDGNAAFYRQDDGRSYWDFGSQGRGGLFAMQTDGNLVIYDRSGRAIWASDTSGHPGAYVVLQNDANLVVYQGTTPLWHSDTVGAVHHEQSSALADIASTFSDIVSTVAPFAQIALSFVPGVGTVVNGAIEAGIALAKGQNITDALIAGAAGALPGGVLAQAAFRAGVAVVKGDNVGTATLNAARDLAVRTGGPVAAAAFDVAVSLTVAQGVQQGEIAPVAIANDNAAPAPTPAALADPLQLYDLHNAAPTFSFTSRGTAGLVELRRIKPAAPPKMSGGKKAAIAVGGVTAAGVASYLAVPAFRFAVEQAFNRLASGRARA